MSLPHPGGHEGNANSRDINLIAGGMDNSNRKGSACQGDVGKEKYGRNESEYQNTILPVATPTPNSHANTRTDMSNQMMKVLIPPLPMTTTPPHTPLPNNTMGIGSWKVSTPPSIEVLRAMYQSSRRVGNDTPYQGTAPILYHPGTTFLPMPPLVAHPDVDTNSYLQSATISQEQLYANAVCNASMPASANSLHDENLASLFRNVSHSDVASQGHTVDKAYVVPSHTTITYPAVDANCQFQWPNIYDSIIKERVSKGSFGNFKRRTEYSTTMDPEPPAKKSKLGTSNLSDPTEEYLELHRIDRGTSSRNDDDEKMHDPLKTDGKDVPTSEADSEIRDEAKIEVKVVDHSQEHPSSFDSHVSQSSEGSRDQAHPSRQHPNMMYHDQQKHPSSEEHNIRERTTTKDIRMRSEREQHIISRKIQRLLLIRHCCTCPVPIPPPPAAAAAAATTPNNAAAPPTSTLEISCPPLSFSTDFCGSCAIDTKKEDHDDRHHQAPPPPPPPPPLPFPPSKYVCPTTSHCVEGKALCAHILACKLKNCTYRGCLTTREVLGHHRRCADEDCEICGPVRALDRKIIARARERERQRERRRQQHQDSTA